MVPLKAAWRIENINRAWRWIRSNSDASYKSYFRELYSAYATADEALLKHLKNRLDRGIFEPSDACKIFFPKPSGILRPYSLLGIEDQIVYQSMANIVAERLIPHVKLRYNKQVFGHQYAGASSLWFYRKWSLGYKAFNTAAERAFLEGYEWTASFDLTAFYDSIDHEVLCHMLKGIGIGQEFCSELSRMLNRWTATKTQIYHHHGIPQGPLSSGLISEVVLKHFDENFKTSYDVRYFRYVDDIRLFAKREDHLRHALVKLDHLSKDVGLFPQSGKIDIHRVTDIQNELKSVSVPVEIALADPIPNQAMIQSRIAELAPRTNGYKVSDSTRFKFLLSHAEPKLRILDRLWRIYEHAPQYYPQLNSYLKKFPVIPDKHGQRLVQEIKSQELYPVIRASLIDAARGRLTSARTGSLRTLLKPLWQPRVNTPELSVELWKSLHQLNHLTERQVDYAVLHTHPAWLKMSLLFGVPWMDIPKNRRDRLLNASMRASDTDSAITSAWIGALVDIDIGKPIRDIHPLAKIILRENGKLRRADTKVCGISMAVKEMIGFDIVINWRLFLGKNYKQAESKIVACKGYIKTNPTAWVNMLDVFNDLMFDALFRRDGSIGSPSLGNFSFVYRNVGFKTKYPSTQAYAVLIHEKRLESELSHAVVKLTKAPTGRIPFRWLKKGKTALKSSLMELSRAGY